MTGLVDVYLKQVEAALRVGNATEHTYRPMLKALLEGLEPDGSVVATNEPKRIACGAPDFIVARRGLTVGYVEAKDVGKSLEEIEGDEQLQRYRRALDSLILTDHLAFRWYVDGALREEARLARRQANGSLRAEKGGAEATADLLRRFLDHRPQAISSPRELAQRLARLAHMVRDIIVTAFEREEASALLRGWREAFARVLISDLGLPEKTAEFADMFAQTLAYGLFTARIMDTTPKTFTRQEAQYLIPKSNPFLRDFFIQISGPQLDDEPFSSFVDDLVNVLAATDMEAVLADFGRRTRQEDPVVHFYETFLAAYDPQLRTTRGVYYTPEPVVGYIVRSVDYLLRTRFDCPQGLADTSKVVVRNTDTSLRVKGKREVRKTAESHKVLVLDPATGTGTFLYAVVDHIRQQFMEGGNAGMWAGYVRNHLLPRLFGFELLMAPYAVAHFKLSLQLAGRDLPEGLREQWAYYPAEGERLGVYLTNALEEAHEMSGLPLFTQWVADETNAANEVKTQLPVLVVMGNPPYSVSSSNRGEWITGLMDSYKTAVRSERNIQPLSDDYIKFIRFAQDRIERTEQGIVAFISNHAYLAGLIHRGMREELMKAFSSIYVLNLHGNATIGEVAPDGGADENVFDIRQGVAIALFVKQKRSEGSVEVFYADVWGRRSIKYGYLLDNDIRTTEWQLLSPSSPNYFFVPKDFSLSEEYEPGYGITQIFNQFQRGVGTRRDHFMVAFEKNLLSERFEIFGGPATDQEIETRFGVTSTSYWSLSAARAIVRQQKDISQRVVQYAYRTFDDRFVLYLPELIERGDAAYGVMQHMLRPNKAILCFRRIRDDISLPFFVVNKLVDKTVLSSKDNMTAFPLYLYPKSDSVGQKSLLDVSVWSPDTLHEGRIPNLTPGFVQAIEHKLGLRFTPTLSLEEDLSEYITPEDVFNYIYAVLYSSNYSERYAEFLKIDFPRIPLTADVGLFRALCGYGAELVALHLLESPAVNQFVTRYPISGDNRVERGYPKYSEPTGERPGRVYINRTQYFEGVAPEVWGFMVGGYQVCEKWLKDRRGRLLSYEELTHYQRVVVALGRTREVMEEIDGVIGVWPVE